MEYAFYNLLTNAVKYSPADTHVRVTAETRGGDLRLSVQDEGIGMDAKELKSIFQKFYRTKKPKPRAKWARVSDYRLSSRL